MDTKKKKKKRTIQLWKIGLSRSLNNNKKLKDINPIIEVEILDDKIYIRKILFNKDGYKEEKKEKNNTTLENQIIAVND